MDVSYELIAFVFGTYLIAGLVKGVIGLGLPSIALALIALVMPPAQAAALLIVPSLVTNVWQMVTGPYLIALIRRLWLLLFGSVIGVWLGGGILTSANSRYAALGLGLALIVYGLVGLTGIRFVVSQQAERWWALPVGLVTGFIAGATGVFVLPAGPYFQAIGLDKDELVQALGLSFTVSTIALGAILLRDGVLVFGNATASLLAVAPALIGMALGQKLRMLSSPKLFQRLFFCGMLALGLHQAIRNLL
jgi:uncharacterized membrane protein YfcA